MNKTNMKISKVLKPHGTSVWLLTNYLTLTVEQIAVFCELDNLKVLFLKKELENGKIYPMSNPVVMGYVTENNLEKSSKDPKEPLVFIGDTTLINLQKKHMKRSYVSLIHKQNILAGSLWIIQFYNNLNITAEHIHQLTGASILNIKKLMINKKYASNVIAEHPVKLNLCSHKELDEIIQLYSKKTL
jgi:hypothetical protein